MLEDHIADLKENCEVDDNVTTHLKSPLPAYPRIHGPLIHSPHPVAVES